MKSSRDLKSILERIDHRGYPAYKDTKGEYKFEKYVLGIDHVQGDPFASPSRLRICVSGKDAGFPACYYDVRHRRGAVQDYLLRRLGSKIASSSAHRGSGKSGLLHISRCGQEILERSACQIGEKDGSITVRFEAGFPANGRTINASELEKILFGILPEVVNYALLFKNLDKTGLDEVICLADSQLFVRNELKNRGFAAFIADGAILPRRSGVSDEPLGDAVRFKSPESMRAKIELPDGSELYGMGIPRGVTLIVGGGYHGKSTLLEALQTGVYDHIAGDGREYVFTDVSAVKVRAEDGRSISRTDISMFINNLPNKVDTKSFCTQNASGSTSQAANVVEAIETGCGVLLIDEDTSATNFMVRDELMQLVVAKDKEPITPYIGRIRELYDTYGVSTILVAGSSGEYFYKADKIIQMEEYCAHDITEYARDIARRHGGGANGADESRVHKVAMPSFDRNVCAYKDWLGDRVKIKTNGKDMVSINRNNIDTRYMEQLADEEQLRMAGHLMLYMNRNVFKKGVSLADCVENMYSLLEASGFRHIFRENDMPCNLAIPRKQELFMCINRFREIGFYK